MLIAGIDEAGRGCLAGPVVAAAVILPEHYTLEGLNDSKLLTSAKREILAPQIKKVCISWGLGVVWQRRIEQINILQASLEAMSLAVAHLKTPPEILYIDGLFVLPKQKLELFWFKYHTTPLPSQKAIKHGDRLNPPISAASIIAKTFRDHLMVMLSKKWPQYGFEKHKGYGTKQHLEKIEKFGVCTLHRATFAGVKQPIFTRKPIL